MFLGFYTVPEAAWQLANTANIYEMEILSLHKRSAEGQVSFSEQLIERLIAASTCISDPTADLPEGHELWRLCLSGHEQEVFVPSSTEGGLSMLPGDVLADMTAPKGMPGVIAGLIAREREIERKKHEARQAFHDSLGSLFSSGGLRIMLGQEPHDDPGFGRAFGNN